MYDPLTEKVVKRKAMKKKWLIENGELTFSALDVKGTRRCVQRLSHLGSRRENCKEGLEPGKLLSRLNLK